MTRKKILIVDDSPVVLTAFQTRLEREGYEIRAAEDPSSALKLMREFKPDVLIVDVNFPPDFATESWDGLKLLEWLCVSGVAREVPAIVITSDQTELHRERAMQVGAVAVFQKPVIVSQLLEAIRLATQDVWQPA